MHSLSMVGAYVGVVCGRSATTPSDPQPADPTTPPPRSCGTGPCRSQSMCAAPLAGPSRSAAIRGRQTRPTTNEMAAKAPTKTSANLIVAVACAMSLHAAVTDQTQCGSVKSSGPEPSTSLRMDASHPSTMDTHPEPGLCEPCSSGPQCRGHLHVSWGSRLEEGPNTETSWRPTTLADDSGGQLRRLCCVACGPPARIGMKFGPAGMAR